MMSHSDFSVEKVAAGEDFADLAAASRDLICSLNRGDGTEFHQKGARLPKDRDAARAHHVGDVLSPFA
jgi:hypothetical protein